MNVKLFEIRDAATFIPIMAVKLDSQNEQERFLLSRAGFGGSRETHNTYVIMIQINGDTGMASSDVYQWGNRTYRVAHQFIHDNFDTLHSGEVIDVQYILGETLVKKETENQQ